MDRITETVSQRQVIVFTTTADVDVAIKDHDVAKSTVGELLKMTSHEANQLISLLRDHVLKPLFIHSIGKCITSKLDLIHFKLKGAAKCDTVRCRSYRHLSAVATRDVG